MLLKIKTIILLLLFTPLSLHANEKLEAEVITWWVSGSERAAIATLAQAYEAQGHRWIDTPVENSYHAKTTAISRILNDKPPSAVQWQAGVSLKQVYSEGLFRDINEVAVAENWQAVLPPAIWENITINDQVIVIAIPMTLHGSNWLWANKAILDEVGEPIPKNWADFLRVATKIKSSGYIALALGGQPWQERALFLPVVLGVGGADFYEKTMVDHDQTAIGSKTMVEVFRVYGSLRQFIDSESKGRKWSETSRLVIDGKAAFQIMGDWVKGEFIKQGKKEGKDYLCALSPGSDGKYLMVSDTFAFGKMDDPYMKRGQVELAKIAMSVDVQRDFNLQKGSIPPRLDVPLDQFDSCAKLAMKTVSKKGAAFPGFNMANTGAMASSIMSVISEFWNDPTMSAEEAAKKMVEEVKKAKI